MQSTIEHPAWDGSWAVPSEHTIDDLAELGLLRCEPSSTKTRTFALSVRGREEAGLLATAEQLHATAPGSAVVPPVDVVLQWLVSLGTRDPGCLARGSGLLDRAVEDGLVEPGGRPALADQLLDLTSDGFLRAAIPDWDQATAEQRLLRTVDLRLTMKGLGAAPGAPAAGGSPAKYRAPAEPDPDEVRDVFVSHAGPDKDSIARPLAEELRARGYSVWFDEFELVVGDRLSTAIDKGLTSSRCGVVILSRDFMARQWTQRELSGLVARETATGARLILPVWHGVDRDEVLAFSAPLADVLAVNTTDGVGGVADAIAPAIDRRRGQEALAGKPLPAAIVAEHSPGQPGVGVDDEALFDFDTARLADFNVARAAKFLDDHGDVYRAQLVMALWIDGWRERMAGHEWSDSDPTDAFDYATRELAAHLRQGDFLPTGVFYRETTDGDR